MIQSPSSQLVFDVNQSNKLLYQEMELKDVAGKFSLNAQGSACVSVQVSAQQKIPTNSPSQNMTSINQPTNQAINHPTDRLTNQSIKFYLYSPSLGIQSASKGFTVEVFGKTRRSHSVPGPSNWACEDLYFTVFTDATLPTLWPLCFTFLRCLFATTFPLRLKSLPSLWKSTQTAFAMFRNPIWRWTYSPCK